MARKSATYKFSVDNEAPLEKKKNNTRELAEYLWNPRTKEFCGRDGASWGKHL